MCAKIGFRFDPNVVPKRFSTKSERDMLEGFKSVADDIICAEEQYKRDTPTFLVGTELELPLVNRDFTLARQEDRDAILSVVPNTSVELGAHQLEIIPEAPVDLANDLHSLEEEMHKAVFLVQSCTRRHNLSWVRLGSYPLCHIREVDYTKGKPKYIKYKRSPSWHQEHQRPSAERCLLTREGPLDVSNAFIVGLLNAIQITVDSTGFEDAIDKLNRSFMISPMAVALAANATHLGYLYTGYADVRFIVWEISHDTRTHKEINAGFPTRVGLPRAYFNDMHDYLNQVLSYPFVMNDAISKEHPFEVGNGIYWRDARIKFFREAHKLGVEFRPIGIQPSLHEDISIMLFYVGRLLWSQHHKEMLLPMEYVKKNKGSAMSWGMKCNLYTNVNGKIVLMPANIALAIEIGRAEEGLSLLGADISTRADYVNVWKQRLSQGSPAEVFLKSLNGKLQFNFAEARCNLIETIEELNLVER